MTRYCPSPNFDARPSGVEVDTIVLHATVLNTLDEVIARFADPESRVSSHYTIDRDGSIVLHVPEDQRAWHAGTSRMKDGRQSVNDFSIGIELVNLNDGQDPYSQEQIESLRSLLTTIIARRAIRYIIGHYECAEPPGRKSDPAGFDPAWISGIID